MYLKGFDGCCGVVYVTVRELAGSYGITVVLLGSYEIFRGFYRKMSGPYTKQSKTQGIKALWDS